MLVDLAAVLPPSHEIIIVDDGNPPAARQRLDELVARHRTVRLISLHRNGGQQRATATGIRSALGAIIVTMDDDGGHPARLVPRMLAMLGGTGTPRDAATPGDTGTAGGPANAPGSHTPSVDLVYGVPDLSGGARLRRAGNIMNRSVFRLFLGVPRGVAVTSYRAFRSTVASQIVGGAPEPGRGDVRRRRAIPPNVSAMLLGERPKLGVVHYTQPTNRSSRHSIRALITGIILLVVWWAPIGLVRRGMGHRESARQQVDGARGRA